MKIRSKLLLAFHVMALPPVIALGVLTWVSSDNLADAGSANLHAVANNLMDKVDRNIFERYGDVEAFALNRVAQDRGHWYKPGESSPLVAAMNRYVSLYGIYNLSILVDPSGKVIAVNSRNIAGEEIATESVYAMNFADAKWLKDACEGKFLSSQTLTGTVVEDAYADPIVQGIYRTDSLTLGFAAPLKDESGKVIGVWKNFADFKLVEDMFLATYETLKSQNLGTAQLWMIDAHGRALVHCDPGQHNGKFVRDTKEVVLKRNLADSGWESAVNAISGKSGTGRDKDWVSGEWQTVGYAPSAGVMGYSGLGWSTIVNVSEAESRGQINALRAKVLTTAALAEVGILGVGLLFAGALVRPIRKIVDRVRDIAEGEGDLTQRVDEGRKDEVGELARWFNAFIQKIHTTVTEVAGAASAVAQASEQISRRGEDVAAALSRQQQQTTQVAAAIEQMSASVSEVAAQSSETAKSASESAIEAGRGGDVVRRTVQEMSGIAEQVNHSAKAVNELGKRGEQIGTIIEVINTIADQTNLLALNAAIEAARAGEHGRGFAVVADEVRKLAERSTKATEEVATSIREIQTETANAVQQIEAGSERVGAGVTLANSAGEALARIVESSKAIMGKVSSIASASEEQSAAAEQISRSVQQIDAITGESTKAAKESAQATSELSQQADRLKALVSTFKV